jgi:hypothetical protein
MTRNEILMFTEIYTSRAEVKATKATDDTPAIEYVPAYIGMDQQIPDITRINFAIFKNKRIVAEYLTQLREFMNEEGGFFLSEDEIKELHETKETERYDELLEKNRNCMIKQNTYLNSEEDDFEFKKSYIDVEIELPQDLSYNVLEFLLTFVIKD